MRKFFPLLLASAVALGHSAVAQNATTTPVGAMTITVAAAPTVSSPKVSTLTIPLFNPVPSNFQGQSVGLITGITDNTITNTSAGWSAGALSQAASPYLVRITTGNATGRIFVVSTSAQNTSTTVTVGDEGTPLTSSGLQVGDSYSIHPADTLLSFFGNGT